MPSVLGAAACAFALLSAACATGSRDRHDRPGDEILRTYAETWRFSLGLPRAFAPAPDGREVLFLRSGPRSFVQDLWSLDLASGEERVVVTAASILGGSEETLSAEEKARRERMRQAARGIASFELSPDGAFVLVPLSGSLWQVDRATGRARELTAAGGHPIDPRLSPDGARVAFAREGRLHVLDLASGEARPVSPEAKKHVTWGTAEFVAQEEMDRLEGYWWSPDGRRVACQRTDTTAVETFWLGDPLHPERAPDPWPYPRPGQANADVSLHVLDAAGAAPAVEVRWDRVRFPYLARVSWEERAPLALLVQDREQEEALLLAADPETGETRTLLSEKDPAWLNLVPGMPRFLPGGAFLWMTEADGSWRLDLHAKDGALVDHLTAPDLGLREVLDVDPARGVAWVLASAEPTEAHVYRLPLEITASHGGLVGADRTTHEPGIHGATFSKDHGIHVLRSEDREGQRTFTVRGPDGRLLGRVRSEAAELPLPRLVLDTVEVDGRTHHAALVYPRDFAPDRSWPVLVHVYGGPGWPVVQARPSLYALDQWFADHGFVVVSYDGRGTPNRGREWERALDGRLLDLPLEDQAAGLEAVGRKHPYLDLSRAGVFGWSFGGYLSALAVMRRPDVFHAGVAVAPVCDWRDYDTHYTERFLGLPADRAADYDRASCTTWAKDLERPLLVLHGTVDDNVYFLHALKMTDALFRAGRSHEFLPLAGFTHMVPDPEVTVRLYTRIADHFVRHLEP